MTQYKDLSREELLKEKENLEQQFAEIKAKGLKLDMSRGKPSTAQLNLSMGMMDVLADGAWQKVFTEKPEVFTKEEKRAWLDQMQDVTLGSDAFFPFSDNIERAHKSGVKYIAEPGGSVRDDLVIETCDKYNMAMAFTGIRLFHH